VKVETPKMQILQQDITKENCIKLISNAHTKEKFTTLMACECAGGRHLEKCSGMNVHLYGSSEHFMKLSVV